MNNLSSDVLHAFRSLRRRPAYTVSCLGTLALVIGSNAAIFAVANATLLRPVPFIAGDRTVSIYLQPPNTTSADDRGPLAGIDVLRFRELSQTMTRVEAFSLRDRLLTESSESEIVRAGTVSAGFFPLMGDVILLGRAFTVEEDRPGSGVAIISHGLWQRRFASDPRVLGQRVSIDDEPHTIVGVTRPAFPPPFLDAELWTPIAIVRETALGQPGQTATFAITVAELREGYTIEQAHDEAAAILRQVEQEFPTMRRGWTAGVRSIREWLYGELRLAIVILMCGTSFVLLMACANIANVTFAQALGRQAEFSLRLALGASRRDLLRLQAVESLLISVVGAGIGLMLAWAAVPTVLRLNPEIARTLGVIVIDWRVQLFTVVAAVVVALLTGALPVRRALSTDAARVLAEGSRRSAGSPAERQLRGALLVLQTAICLTLLICGATLYRGFTRAASTPPGFDPSGILTAQIRLPVNAYGTAARRAQTADLLLERVRAVPGVRAAGTTMNLFQPGTAYTTVFHVENRPTPNGQPHPAQFRRISPGYFQTMRVPILNGRDFTRQDQSDRPLVVIISRSLAERHWPGEDPVGRRVLFGAQPVPREIVGVVGDVSDVGLGMGVQPTLYLPYSQSNNAAVPLSLVIRAEGNPLSLVAAVREAVLSVDPLLPIHRVGTMDTFLSESVGPERFRTTVVAMMAALGLLLAAIGVYGVTARGVVERTREFGVRVALGSSSRQIIRTVTAQALRSVLIGSLLGAIAGVLLSRWMGSVLTNVEGPDVRTGVAAFIGVAVVAVAAAVVPAVRVLRLNPVDALRAE